MSHSFNIIIIIIIIIIKFNVIKIYSINVYIIPKVCNNFRVYAMKVYIIIRKCKIIKISNILLIESQPATSFNADSQVSTTSATLVYQDNNLAYQLSLILIRTILHCRRINSNSFMLILILI